MFDQILQLVKEHFNNNPELSNAIPAGQEDDLHNEIANHINNSVQNPAAPQGESGGLLSSLESSLTSGSPVGSAIEGGLVGSLASKFGLPPVVTGAIAAALPVLINKYTNKSNPTPEAG